MSTRGTRFKLISYVLFLCFAVALELRAGNPVIPGELIIEPPTLICLGFEWYIEGDDNRNATVEVRCRKKGEPGWNEVLPLLRIGGERIKNLGVYMDYTTPHMFAGSILDLEPGTEYECRLELKDPDGVRGEAEKAVTLHTREEPEEYAGGKVLHVYPPEWKDERQQPAFTGLMKAYQGAGGGDWAVVSERKVTPGDIILMHAGRYKAERLNYSDRLNLPFHGTYVLTAKGTPEKPIVIRAAGDGEVIFDGDGCYRLFDVMAADYHIFDGITVRNCGIAFYAGLKDVLGCSGLVVRNCRIENVGIAVTTQYAGSKNFYIADNVIIGRDDSYRLVGWYDPGIYGASRLESYYAIKVYGQGHVVCHNYIACFHDGICVCTHGSPATEQDRKCVAIDFYNNDIHLMTDDFIEADGGVHNIRILRNRCFNSAQCGLSAQPVFGGPAYYIRNILYHVPWGMALKLEANPAGLIFYHNTICAENHKGAPHSNAYFRNNLFLGTDHPERALMRLSTYTSYTTYDYNGYRPNRVDYPQFFWNSPTDGKTSDFGIKRQDAVAYRTLEEFRRATGQEVHGIIVDYDIFEKVTKPDPALPHAVYSAGNFDFRLKKGSAAVDAGVILPNVNVDFAGKAPDLGALEYSRPMPFFGPR
ncbi:MAG: hypothetical protein U9P14_00100 [Gemmatimonadota bacterium]|nr:hypothetical protein [Gemmatimonadota bacterium]